MTRVAIVGIGGRMGEEILRLSADAGVQVVGGSHAGPGEAEQASRLGIPVDAQLAAALDRGPEAVIDFSSPEACVEAQLGALQEVAGRIPLLHAPNMSVGVQLLLRLVEEAARSLGEGFDAEIVEFHHRHKKDAPSGTALRLAETLAEALGRDLSKEARYGREGQVGARTPGEIGVMALRGGDVVGDHTVYFLGDGERIELTHKASSRGAFASGALRAAKWIVGKPAGSYAMKDLL